MTYLTLPKDLQGFILFWTGTIQLLLFFNFFSYLQLGRRKSNVRCILLVVTNFMLFEILARQSTEDIPFPIVIPLWGLLILLGLLTVFAIAEQYRIAKWRREHISVMSIKQALDALPTGLCYSVPDGLPLLVNQKMDELVGKLLDSMLLDAKEVWERLEKGDGKGVLRTGAECIYRLPDGKIYGFHQQEIQMQEGTVMLLQAMDITEEYSMTEELAEKQKKAKTINTRLKSLMGTIEYVTMSRELLNMKVALHDNLGQCLLAARRYILNPQSVDPKELLNIWRINMEHLIGETPEEWQVPYYIAKKEASTLGIDLQIVGTLPEEAELLPVIDQAISAHVINVLRHADGKTARVLISEEEKEYRISFKNDGNPPEGEIQMTGGLGNLKRKVEEVGGHMEVYSRPAFEMDLVLPKR